MSQFAVRLYVPRTGKKKSGSSKSKLYPKGYLAGGEVVKKKDAKLYKSPSDATKAGASFQKRAPDMTFKVVPRVH